jgi:hypothetical protein
MRGWGGYFDMGRQKGKCIKGSGVDLEDEKLKGKGKRDRAEGSSEATCLQMCRKMWGLNPHGGNFVFFKIGKGMFFRPK